MDRDVGSLAGVPCPPPRPALALAAAAASPAHEQLSRTSSASSVSMARTLSFTRGGKFTRGESMTLDDARRVLDESSHAYAGSLKFAAVQLIIGDKIECGATPTNNKCAAPTPLPPPPPPMPPNTTEWTGALDHIEPGPLQRTPDAKRRVAFALDVPPADEANVDPAAAAAGVDNASASASLPRCDSTEFNSPGRRRPLTRLLSRSFSKARRAARVDDESSDEAEGKDSMPNSTPRDSLSANARRTRTESPGGSFFANLTPRKSLPSFTLRSGGTDGGAAGGADAPESRQGAREREHKSRVRTLLTSIRKGAVRNEDMATAEHAMEVSDEQATVKHGEDDAAAGGAAPSHRWVRSLSFRTKRARLPKTRGDANGAAERVLSATRNKEEPGDKEEVEGRSKVRRGKADEKEGANKVRKDKEDEKQGDKKVRKGKNGGVEDGKERKESRDRATAEMQAAPTPVVEVVDDNDTGDMRKVRMPGSGRVLTVSNLPVETSGRQRERRSKTRTHTRFVRRTSARSSARNSAERLVAVR